MRAQDVVHVIDGQELLNHLRAKCITGATRRERELVAIRVWIRPYKIGHRALVGYFSEAVYDLDLIDRVYRRGKAWPCELASATCFCLVGPGQDGRAIPPCTQNIW